MKLHKYLEDFRDLIQIVSQAKHIPSSAVERDYYIVMLLQNLEKSDYADRCVFKGGTSLSKCYPGSIERFSEDIDLTIIGMDLPDGECEKEIIQSEFNTKLCTKTYFTQMKSRILKKQLKYLL